MSIIKETKEFFLRNKQVSVGENSDKETGFPVEYKISDGKGGFKTVYNRFLKGNYPSENVFKKLLESVPFFLNKESTATKNQQGLVKIATTEQIQNDVNDESGIQLVVEPSKTSIVEDKEFDYDISENANFTNFEELKTNLPSKTLNIENSKTGDKGKKFIGEIHDSFINWIGLGLQSIINKIVNSLIVGHINFGGDPQNPITGNITFQKSQNRFRFSLNVALPDYLLFPHDLIYNVGDIMILFTDTEFNLDTGLPIENSRFYKWAIADGRNGTVDFRGKTLAQFSELRSGESYNNTSLNNALNAIGNETGVFQENLTINNLPSHTHDVQVATQIVYGINLPSGGTSSVLTTPFVAPISYTGNNQPHNNIQPTIAVLIIQKIIE